MSSKIIFFSLVATVSLLGFSTLQDQDVWGAVSTTLDDQSSCESIQGVWTYPNTCTFPANVIPVGKGDSLIVDSGIVVENHSHLRAISGGNIDNFGIIINHNILSDFTISIQYKAI